MYDSAHRKASIYTWQHRVDNSKESYFEPKQFKPHVPGGYVLQNHAITVIVIINLYLYILKFKINITNVRSRGTQSLE
jgi:hypothetical protein